MSDGHRKTVIAATSKCFLRSHACLVRNRLIRSRSAKKQEAATIAVLCRIRTYVDVCNNIYIDISKHTMVV